MLYLYEPWDVYLAGVSDWISCCSVCIGRVSLLRGPFLASAVNASLSHPSDRTYTHEEAPLNLGIWERSGDQWRHTIMIVKIKKKIQFPHCFLSFLIISSKQMVKRVDLSSWNITHFNSLVSFTLCFTFLNYISSSSGNSKHHLLASHFKCNKRHFEQRWWTPVQNYLLRQGFMFSPSTGKDPCR